MNGMISGTSISGARDAADAGCSIKADAAGVTPAGSPVRGPAKYMRPAATTAARLDAVTAAAQIKETRFQFVSASARNRLPSPPSANA